MPSRWRADLLHITLYQALVRIELIYERPIVSKGSTLSHAPNQPIARIELIYERPIVSKGSTLHSHAPYQPIARIELVYERPIVSKGSTLQMHPFNQLRNCFYPDDARRWILTVPHLLTVTEENCGVEYGGRRWLSRDPWVSSLFGTLTSTIIMYACTNLFHNQNNRDIMTHLYILIGRH